MCRFSCFHEKWMREERGRGRPRERERIRSIVRVYRLNRTMPSLLLIASKYSSFIVRETNLLTNWVKEEEVSRGWTENTKRVPTEERGRGRGRGRGWMDEMVEPWWIMDHSDWRLSILGLTLQISLVFLHFLLSLHFLRSKGDPEGIWVKDRREREGRRVPSLSWSNLHSITHFYSLAPLSH